MSITRASLSDALAAVGGRAAAFYGSATIAAGLAPLGMLQGAATVEEVESYEDLTADITHGAVHERDVVQEAMLVTVRLVQPAAALSYDKFSSIGDGDGGGWEAPKPVVPATLLLIPFGELGSNGQLAYAGAVWTPSAPVHAVWLWRAVPEGNRSYEMTNDRGQKQIVREIRYRTLWDGSKPDGHKLWTRGDPASKGITGIAI
jgi:hypothetical protein